MYIKGWKMFFLNFHTHLTNFCNTCELINVSSDILNTGGNIEDKSYYEFTGTFLKIPYYYR